MEEKGNGNKTNCLLSLKDYEKEVQKKQMKFCKKENKEFYHYYRELLNLSNTEFEEFYEVNINLIFLKYLEIKRRSSTNF